MTSVFSKVIAGELPGRIVYTDDRCAAFLTIAPVRTGHLLVVPRDEIDKWTDLPPDLLTHLTAVAQRLSRAIEQATGCQRVGLLIAGFEVPHAHIHLMPTESMADLDLANATTGTDPAEQDAGAEKIRLALAS